MPWARAFDDRATGKVAAFCPNAAIIHIDIDPSELDKIKTAHVGIAGDVGAVLAQLLPQVQAPCAKTVQRWPSSRPSGRCKLPGLDDPRSHYGLAQAVADALDDSALSPPTSASIRCGWRKPTCCAARANG